ncbi:MAG: hypothetical protein M3044_00155 [Thermoproteota archaeon]|nr:hypothetical protein [Thermoproteota archaeon]
MINFTGHLGQLFNQNASNTNLTHDIDDNQVSNFVSLIKPYYRLGFRNSFVMYLSGWLRKGDIMIASARQGVLQLCEDDEEKDARLRTRRNLSKGRCE